MAPNMYMLFDMSEMGQGQRSMRATMDMKFLLSIMLATYSMINLRSLRVINIDL